jgi:citrate synthase
MAKGMGENRYLTAREAAGELGISTATLYAYVSRGLIRSEATGGKRRDRRYRAEDVGRLRERKEQRRDPARVARGALDWGTPVLESAITLIADGRVYYRGRDAVDLSGSCSLEQVAELIWTGAMSQGSRERPPEIFRASAGEPIAPDSPRVVGEGIRNRIWTDTFAMALHGSAEEDPAAYDLRAAAVARTGARILRLLAASAVGDAPDAGDTVARSLQRRWVPRDTGAAGLIDRALVLCADHELNVSSFTARCVASAGATPYAVVVAGLAALGGVKHGGNTERVEALLDEIEAADDAERAVAARLRRGEAVPGFGHPLYPDGDPRAEALLAVLAGAYPGSRTRQPTAETAKAVGDLMDERPNVDFALVALARTLRLPPGAALALFALGRTAGWVGHAIEQYQADIILRPRALYVGEQPAGL